MANPANLKHLLSSTKQIIKHHDEITLAKGEHFNLFSVLKIEGRENNTHSAFLAELLNPNGSHKQGSVFLQLFLQVINKDFSEVQKINKELIKIFAEENTTVSTEYHVGKISWEHIEGGRIDIFMKNGKNTLSIENKIYAPDQKAQVQRYCNYNPEKNTVFYLTLEGEDPHINSKGTLVSGEHFFNLSYREHIIEWLELCLKEVPNLTSVREAINQYILLIKKLTHMLNSEQNKELENYMMQYMEEAEYIAVNYEKMISQLHSKFREDVKRRLEENLDQKIFSIEDGLAIERVYSQLWIKLKNPSEPEFKFGIASFSGKGHLQGNLFVGLLYEGKEDLIRFSEKNGIDNQPWIHIDLILQEDKKVINLREKSTLQILAQPESSHYKILMEKVVAQSLNFIEELMKNLASQNLNFNKPDLAIKSKI